LAFASDTEARIGEETESAGETSGGMVSEQESQVSYNYSILFL